MNRQQQHFPEGTRNEDDSYWRGKALKDVQNSKKDWTQI
jgi:hypothetical protein